MSKWWESDKPHDDWNSDPIAPPQTVANLQAAYRQRTGAASDVPTPFDASVPQTPVDNGLDRKITQFSTAAGQTGEAGLRDLDFAINLVKAGARKATDGDTAAQAVFDDTNQAGNLAESARLKNEAAGTNRAGAITGTILSLAPTLAAAEVAAPARLAVGAGRLAQVGSAVAGAAPAAGVIATEQSAANAGNRLTAGSDLGDVEKLYAADLPLNFAANLLPVSAPGNVLTRAITGGGIGAATSAATAATEHAIAPNAAPAPTLDSTLEGGGIGAILAAALGHGAGAVRPEARLTPDPVPEPAAPPLGIPADLPINGEFRAGARPVQPESPGTVRVDTAGNAYTPQQGSQAVSDALSSIVTRPALPEPVVHVDPQGVATTTDDQNAAIQSDQAARQAVVDAAQNRRDLGITPDIERTQAPKWAEQDEVVPASKVPSPEQAALPAEATRAPSTVADDPAFSFAGENARTADRVSLENAKNIEAFGRDQVPDRFGNQPGSPEDTHVQTGWHRGADDKWRFEIDDSDARLVPSDSWEQPATDRGVPLTDVLDHPSLIDAYPQLGDVQVKVDDSIKSRGGYDPATNTITVRKSYRYPSQGADSLKSTLIHELQHVVQTEEGFARGGNSAEFVRPRVEERDRLTGRQAAIDKLLADAPPGARRDQLLAERGKVSGQLREKGLADDQSIKTGAFKDYQRLAGEVEARNTQSRLDLSEDERRSTPPSETADTPREQQTVKFNSRPSERNNREADSRSTENLSKRLSGYIGKDVSIAPARSVPDAVSRALAEFDKAFGGRTVVFDNANPEALDFQGVTLRDGVRFVNSKTDAPLLGVAAHEMLHQMRADRPDLYEELEAEIRKQGKLDKYGENVRERARRGGENGDSLTDAQIREELTADAVGDALTDPEFLEQLAKKNPGLFAKVADYIKDFLDRVVSRLKALGSSEYLDDITAFRTKLEDVLERYGYDRQGDRSVARSEAPEKPEAQTNTKAFKDWFGDSKVVDESGNPLKVYHGTGKSFDAFNTHGEGKTRGSGAFLSSDPTIASSYAPREGGSVVPSYVKLEKPMVIDANGSNWASLPSDAKVSLPEITKKNTEDDELLRSLGMDSDGPTTETTPGREGTLSDVLPRMVYGDSYSVDTIAKWARQQGYDGVIFKNVQDRGPHILSDDGEAKTSSTYAVFDPKNIKSAVGNKGTFDPTDDNIMFSRRQYTPEQKTFMEKAGLSEDERSTIQKVKESLTDVKDKAWYVLTDPQARYVVKQQATDQITQSMTDRLHGLKVAERGKGFTPDQSAYVAARLATGSPAILGHVLEHGGIKWADSASATGDKSVPSLMDAIAPVKNDLNEWLGWMVANRAERLKTEGRENLMSDDDIKAGKSLSAGKTPEFTEAAEDYDALRTNILDFAEKAGTINPDTRAMWDQAGHIPFYRLREDGDVAGPGTTRGLANQKKPIKQLKGGESALKDPLSNIVQNFASLIDGAVKNNAALMAIKNNPDMFTKAPPQQDTAMISLPQVKAILRERGVPESAIKALGPDALKGMQQVMQTVPPTGDDVIRVLEKGKPTYYRVSDPLMYRALTGMQDFERSLPVKALGLFKHLLTAGVTTTPTFAAANLLRDAGEAYLTSGVNMIPVAASVNGAIKAIRHDPVVQDLMASGSSFHGGLYQQGNNDATAKVIRRALRAKGKDDAFITKFLKTVTNPANALRAYRSLLEAGETGSRVAVYSGMKKKGASNAEAALAAKDLLDFSKRGDSQILAFFTDTTPFLNARIQGLSRLTRVAKGENAAGTVDTKLRNTFLRRIAALTAISTLLYAWNQQMYKDGYDQLEEWDKDTYWHIAPGTKAHIRIPKPFELGLVAGTLPERILGGIQHALGKGGDDAKTLGQSFWRALTGTLEVSPPQFFKPIIEEYANTNMFTGRPIETQADQKLLPEARSNWYTSDTAQAIGEATGTSPKRIEHLVNGYLGGLGTAGLKSADWMVRLAKGSPQRPDAAMRDFPVLGRFFRGDDAPANTKQLTKFYNDTQKADQVAQTIKEYLVRADERHDPSFEQKAKDLAAENKDILGDAVVSRRAKAGIQFSRTQQNTKMQGFLTSVRDENESISQDTKLTPEQKRQRINANIEERNQLLLQYQRNPDQTVIPRSPKAATSIKIDPIRASMSSDD